MHPWILVAITPNYPEALTNVLGDMNMIALLFSYRIAQIFRLIFTGYQG
jgi:hypothetical protein